MSQLNARVLRGLGEIRSLAVSERDIGEQGSFDASNGGSGDYAAISSAIDLIGQVLSMPRGSALVPATPFEARQLLRAADNSLTDPDFMIDHLPTAARREAAQRLAERLQRVIARQDP